MDFVDPILCIASQIYALVDKVKGNKNRCRRVSDRVRALGVPVQTIKQQKAVPLSAEVKQALKELHTTLMSAKDLIKKYTMSSFIKRILKANSYNDGFNSVNERLDDAFQVLFFTLSIEQRIKLHKVFEETSRKKEDEVDGKEDDAELKRLLLEHMQKKEEELRSLINKMEMMNKPSMTGEDIRVIKPEELKYEHPKKPFMTTSTSEVYRGEYHGFTAAIKRYIDPVNTSPGEVRSVFSKEVETMKRFESPNILRMFGICVQDEDTLRPQYLIIMEYCEKGSLRQVLDSGCNLSWTRKARMCLDAAQGLYRMHQTEEKSKVHGSINSSTFLVAEGYRVKLGGFELSKTETSLRKSPKDNDMRSLCYRSPQKLGNISHAYNKECEMYSFGIVLWEVATRRRPFEGFSDEEIKQKVYKEKYQEPLPDECPEQLGQLITSCRAYDSFERPSAGLLMDQLRSVVEKLEEE